LTLSIQQASIPNLFTQLSDEESLKCHWLNICQKFKLQELSNTYPDVAARHGFEIVLKPMPIQDF